MQNKLQISNEEEKQNASKVVEIARQAQQNHQSVVHSRFVNENISSKYLNMKNTVDALDTSDTIKDDSNLYQ